MKNKSIRLAGFALLISLFVIFTLFCSCTGIEDGEETSAVGTEAEGSVTLEESDSDENTEETSEETTVPEDTEPEEMTMAPVETIDIIVGGKTDYVLYCSNDVAEKNPDDLEWMQSVMEQKFGVRLVISAEKTGKYISLEYGQTGNQRDWAVDIDKQSGNIRITAGCPEVMAQAVRYFVTQFCGYVETDLKIDASGSYEYDYEASVIDNSSLLSWNGGKDCAVAVSDKDGKLMTPAWLDKAVMVEVRLDTASIGGTFNESYDLIDFYAKTGVNVIWLVPIYQRGAGGNGYGNIGLHTVEPALTETEDQDEGWKVVKNFVDHAHSKGIYILFDIVSWGTMKSAPLLSEHPDWFSGEAWGNAAFNWKNSEFREWFISTAVENIIKTGADGYRCDCEPFTAGYDVYTEIRARLNAQGYYPVIMSEEGGKREAAFDCEQDGVLAYSRMSRGELYQKPVNFFVDGYLKMVTTAQKGRGLGAQNLQSSSKAGNFRYYTNCITNHDYQRRDVCGNRLKIGYAAIYAPYIPLWYMGDEFGAEATNVVLYDRAVDFGLIDKNAEDGIFFEDVKQMINIRRSYPEIFENWPLSHRDSNICEVKVDGLTELQNYARYAGDKMIIIAANHEGDANKTGICKISIPFESGFTGEYANYRVTDLLTGRVIRVGRAETVDGFCAIVPPEFCGVFLIEGIN